MQFKAVTHLSISAWTDVQINVQAGLNSLREREGDERSSLENDPGSVDLDAFVGDPFE